MSSENNIENSTLEKPKKQTKKTREQIEEYEAQIAELGNQEKNLNASLESLSKDVEALSERSALKMKVKHRKYGIGTIVKQEEKYIDVKFDSVTKKFVLPGAIAEKYLKTDDDEVFDYYTKSFDLHNKIQKVQLQLRSNDFAVQRIKENIDKINHK